MLVAPHFLFNTMNAIKVLVRQQQDRAAGKMLERLTDFLNYALLARDAHEVALHRELEHVQLYLAIEQVRFGDRLLLDVTVEPDLADAAVPYMCLQPLVENAIRHGIGRSSAGGVLRIRASRDRGRIRIEVEDNGPGSDAVFARRKGSPCRIRGPDSSSCTGKRRHFHCEDWNAA